MKIKKLIRTNKNGSFKRIIEFDLNGNRTHEQAFYKDKLKVDQIFKYDENGNCIYKKDLDTEIEVFSEYDNNNRLIYRYTSSGEKYYYDYDDNGNRYIKDYIDTKRNYEIEFFDEPEA